MDKHPERRHFDWRKWLTWSIAILGVAIPMYGLYKTNEAAINDASKIQNEQHAAAAADRAVTHVRLNILEQDVKMLMQHDLQECRK